MDDEGRDLVRFPHGWFIVPLLIGGLMIVVLCLGALAMVLP